MDEVHARVRVEPVGDHFAAPKVLVGNAGRHIGRVLVAADLGLVAELSADADFEVAAELELQRAAHREDGRVVALARGKTSIANAEQHFDVFCVVAGRQTDRVGKDLRRPHVVEPQVAEALFQSADLEDEVRREDVARLDVEPRQGKDTERSHVDVGVLEGAAFNLGDDRGVGIALQRVLDEVELERQRAPGAFVEQATIEVPVAELAVAALEVGACHDAEVTAGVEAIARGLGLSLGWREHGGEAEDGEEPGEPPRKGFDEAFRSHQRASRMTMDLDLTP